MPTSLRKMKGNAATRVVDVVKPPKPLKEAYKNILR